MRITTIPLLFLCLAQVARTAPSWVLVEEASTEKGWGLNAGREFPGAKASVAMGKAPDGTVALQANVDLTKGGHYAGPERWVSIPSATRLRFRVWSEGISGLMVRLRDMKNQEHAGSAKLTPGAWQTVELSLDAKGFPGHWHGPNDGLFYFPVRRLLIAASNLPNKKGRFWLRDIQMLTEDTSMLWGVEVHTEQPGNIFFHAEQPATPAMHIHNRVATPAQVEATWRLVDQTGRRTQTSKQALSFAPWERKILSPELPSLDHGHYLLSVTLRSGNTVVGSGEGAFGIVEKLPNYGPEKDPESYFGMHINNVPAAARIGVKWDRPQRAWWWGEARRKDYLWPDTNMDLAPQYGIGVMMTLHYGPPSWAKKLAGERPLWPPPPELMAGWADYVAACVKRYDSRVDCWEIQNEPDLTCYYHEKIPFETGVQSYAEIIRTAHKAIRATGSEHPVSGVDVSGGDYRNNLRFSRAVLKEVGALIDIYTGHPYASPRYFGAGKSPLFPLQNRLVEKLELSKAMLREFDGERPIWVGEKGWGLDVKEPLTGPHSMAYAACVAQALITGRSVPGISRWYWFLQNGANEDGHEYGLWRGNPAQPLPAAIAYAGCARFLHHVAPARRLGLPDGLQGFAFKGSDPARAVVALWTMSDDAVLQADWPAGTKAYTMYGREANPAALALTRAPAYLVAPLARAGTLFAKVEQAAPKPRVPVRVEAVHFAHANILNARLRNLLPQRVRAELRVGGKTTRAILKPKAEGTLALKLPTPVPETVAVEILAEGIPVLKQTLSPRFAPCPRRSPTVDGDLAEWGKPQATLANRKDILPPDPNIGWSGPEDLSVEAWWGWSRKGLCFAARVQDETHSVADATAGTFWKSDSIQLAIDVGNDAGNEPEFGPDDREFGFIAAGERGKAFETVPRSRELAIACVAKRQGTSTVYEAIIPWRELGTKATVGRVLSLNFIVNDNDGHGRSYWIGLRPGIGEAKRPGLYLDVSLAK
jgi:hypothetical protein